MSDNASSLSRRGFLKGIGVGSMAGGLLSPFGLRAQGPGGLPQGVRGPGEIPVTLQINGQSRKLNVEPRVTLLDALRNRLDLTGAKKVCDRGTCGACTVLVDGIRIRGQECILTYSLSAHKGVIRIRGQECILTYSLSAHKGVRGGF